MKFIDAIKSFFGGSKIDPSVLAAIKSFNAASDRYDIAFDALGDYLNRAYHRYALLDAQRAINRASEPCFTKGVNMDAVKRLYEDDAVNDAVAAFEDVRAECHDPADFEPYTVDYLAAHTGGMDVLTTTFDELTIAFAAVSSNNDLYASAAAVYNATCDTYQLAAKAYRNAAHCALINALEGNIQAQRDNIDAYISGIGAANPAGNDPTGGTSKAATRSAKAAEDATRFKLLEVASRTAESMAEELVAQAKSAHDHVETILESLKPNDV